MYDELLDIIRDHKLDNEHQISITSMEGNDDWYCSVGKLYELQHKEKFYSTINKSLEGSKIHQFIQSQPLYYRWRAIRGLDKDDPVENKGQMQSNFKEFEKNLKKSD